MPRDPSPQAIQRLGHGWGGGLGHPPESFDSGRKPWDFDDELHIVKSDIWSRSRWWKAGGKLKRSGAGAATQVVLLSGGGDVPTVSSNQSSQAEEDPVAFSNWLEPAWRSDRMSWTLLGVAVSLAFEAGAFDKIHYICQDRHGPGSECAHKQRVRRMVLVYMSQTSGRLGLKPTLSYEQWQSDPVFEQTSQAHRMGPADPVDIMQECWLGIAGLMYKANEEIFPSKKYTSEITNNGKYVEKIEQFKPLLRAWRDNFDHVKHQFTPVMQNLLSMEYDYARMFIHSLGFQKVVESWVRMANNKASTETNGEHTVGRNFAHLLNIWRPNREYINEVSGAAHNMLRTVRDGLVPSGHLIHASNRSYFRILPAMLFTMKVGSHIPPAQA